MRTSPSSFENYLRKCLKEHLATITRVRLNYVTFIKMQCKPAIFAASLVCFFLITSSTIVYYVSTVESQALERLRCFVVRKQYKTASNIKFMTEITNYFLLKDMTSVFCRKERTFIVSKLRCIYFHPINACFLLLIYKKCSVCFTILYTCWLVC